jgi:Na+-translocating ferredoxin:NAD+ oxidoreductase subunit B
MENQDIYRALADHLDTFPQGFPATKSGKELELLAYLFTPDEAQFALNLTQFFQPISEIAESTGLDLADCQGLVKRMLGKGLLNMRRGTSSIEINLPAFIVGFYENQVFRIDETFAQIFEDYYREVQGEFLSVQPQFHRVIPVHESINTEIEILPEEDVTAILSNKQAWAVMDCICRKQQALLGRGCDHPLKVCLAMSNTPGAFDSVPQMDALDLASALEVLDMAAQSGLVHTISNRKSDISYVCNCCTCGCGILRGISEAHMANVVARSSYFAVVDEDLCIGCGECELGCQFDAITMDAVAMIDRVACVGCGVCTRVCPETAIRLVQREPEEIKPIPGSTDEWLTQRRQARGMN